MSRSATATTAAIAAAAPAPMMVSDTPVAPASSSSSSSSYSAATDSTFFPYWRYNNLNPDSLRLRLWILPGTAIAGVSGLVLGGSIGAVLNRPLLNSAKNVALKFALPSFMYLASVSLWSRRAAPEWNSARLPVHLGHGLAVGALMGGVVGRARGALAGAALGAALALPAYYILEGRHESARNKLMEQNREEEDKRIEEYKKSKQAEQQQQQQKQQQRT